MQYLSISTIKEDSLTTILTINFEFNMSDEKFKKLSSSSIYFSDIMFNNIYKSSEEFFDKKFFNDFIKKIFDMDDKLISEFYNILINLKQNIEDFSMSKISLYTYITSIYELCNEWNTKYDKYQIDCSTENSIKIIYYIGKRKK